LSEDWIGREPVSGQFRPIPATVSRFHPVPGRFLRNGIALPPKRTVFSFCGVVLGSACSENESGTRFPGSDYC
jgi:hypothetical protein